MSLSFVFAQSSSGAAIATADNDDDNIANLDADIVLFIGSESINR